jgi:hypothetical protein
MPAVRRVMKLAIGLLMEILAIHPDCGTWIDTMQLTDKRSNDVLDMLISLHNSFNAVSFLHFYRISLGIRSDVYASISVPTGNQFQRA